MTMVPIVDGPRPPARAAPVQCGGVRDGPGRCPASTAFWRSLRVAEVHEPRCNLPAHLRNEAVASEQRVRTLASLAGVRDTREGLRVRYGREGAPRPPCRGPARHRAPATLPSTRSIVARSMPFSRAPGGSRVRHAGVPGRVNRSSARRMPRRRGSRARGAARWRRPRIWSIARTAQAAPDLGHGTRATSRKRAAASRTTWGSSTAPFRWRRSAGFATVRGPLVFRTARRA